MAIIERAEERIHKSLMDGLRVKEAYQRVQMDLPPCRSRVKQSRADDSDIKEVHVLRSSEPALDGGKA